MKNGIFGLGLAAVLATALPGTAAHAQQAPVKIGFIATFSGPESGDSW